VQPRPGFLLASGPLLGALLVVVSVDGCVLDPIELDGRACPCIEGWRCDETTERCVREVLADGGGDGAVLEVDAAPEVDGGPRIGCAAIPDALFCDDFESGALDRWTLDSREGGVIEATAAARSGEGAVRLAAPGSATALLAGVLPATEGDLHFRAWIQIAADTEGEPFAFALRAGDQGTILAQLSSPTRTFALSAAATGSEASLAMGAPDLWQHEVWTCVRARVARGGGRGGRVELGRDGEALVVLSAISTRYGAPFDAFTIGIAGDGPSELRIDDVAWAAAPLTCD
jgi:hypothetical protein